MTFSRFDASGSKADMETLRKTFDFEGDVDYGGASFWRNGEEDLSGEFRSYGTAFLYGIEKRLKEPERFRIDILSMDFDYREAAYTRYEGMEWKRSEVKFA